MTFHRESMGKGPNVPVFGTGMEKSRRAREIGVRISRRNFAGLGVLPSKGMPDLRRGGGHCLFRRVVYSE